MDFKGYTFIKTDESVGEMDHSEFYFELESDEKVNLFMKEFHISLDKFDLSDIEKDNIFVGLDFQLSIYPNNITTLAIGPVYKDSENDYITADVNTYDIDGLKEYLLSQLK